jgi:hypothetical protein
LPDREVSGRQNNGKPYHGPLSDTGFLRESGDLLRNIDAIAEPLSGLDTGRPKAVRREARYPAGFIGQLPLHA